MFRGIRNIDELLKKAEFQGTKDYHFPDNPSPESASGEEIPSTTSGELGNSLSKTIGDGLDHKKPEDESGFNNFGRIDKKNGNPEVTVDKSSVE